MKIKKILNILIGCVCTINIAGQVGIGTTTPVSSSILDITSANKGVLLPRVSLSATNSISPFTGTPANGTMVFNTADAGTGTTAVIPGIYVWNDTKWVFPGTVGKVPQKAVKFTNPATSTINFNPSTVATPVSIDIFGSQLFNDDTAVFEKLDNNSLKINQAGLYFISLNLALRQNPAVDQSRLSDYIYFNLDGVLASARLITLVPQYNPSDVNISGRFAFGLNTYINAAAGQVLTLNSARYKDGANYNGTVNYDGTSLSSVTIIKVK